MTAAVIVRPETTTISERAELNMENMMENGEEIVEDDEALPQPPKIRRAVSRNSGEHFPVLRQVSRNIAEDDSDIIKMKEYMEQKGL